ncbi:hypothetical protein SAMN05216483_6479 [Streptomyces sp. 2131.1]|uniref:hypothetical protein n=1 Tax=Streptomyces sp. 2131.1 TaxID=1855346 RepID=UPI000895CFCC|nr:hypothetical protein [Streptomyces sp. 2131.1]SEE51647.1 hypothetical protein SAMN05216483_6479 [Streptomyces sp. 2131.1]
MRAHRLATRFALPSLAVLLFSGCDSATTVPDPASSTARQAGPPTGPENRSLWTLIDADGETIETLADDDPDVTAIRRTVVLHSGAVDDRNSASVTESLKSEFSFYGVEFRKALEARSYATKAIALFRDNALATRQQKVAWYRSTVFRNRRTAKAEMDTVFEFTAGDPAYLKKGGLAVGTPYTEHRTISLAKQGSTWVITGIRRTPLERPAPKPVTQ